jgi:hypothetical protein
VCKIFRNYGFGLPQAHKRDRLDVLHASWLYASEQKEKNGVAYVHGDFLQTGFYKQVTNMHTCKMHIFTLRFLSIVPEETNLRKQGQITQEFFFRQDPEHQEYQDWDDMYSKCLIMSTSLK